MAEAATDMLFFLFCFLSWGLFRRFFFLQFIITAQSEEFGIWVLRFLSQCFGFHTLGQSNNANKAWSWLFLTAHGYIGFGRSWV